MDKTRKELPQWMIALVPAILAVLLYLNTIPNTYCLDDYCVIVNNSYVQEGLDGITKLLSTNFFNGFNGFNDGLYRPVPMVTFALEYAVFGMNPHINHLVNLLLYGLTGFVLFFLMKKISGKGGSLFPLVVSLLFIAHPVHTEVVGNIKGRDDLMAFLTAILAMFYFYRYCEARTIGSLLAGLVFFLLSLLSKESSLMFLFVIPLMVFLFTKTPVKTQWTIGAILVVITAGWLLLRYSVIQSMPNPVDKGIFSTLNNSILATEDPLSRVATAAFLQLMYLVKLFFPVGLSHDYSYNQIPPVAVFSLEAGAAILVLALVVVSLFISYKRNPKIFFGILFYFLTIATVSNLLLYIGATFAERFLFTPSLGFSLVTGTLLLMLVKTEHPADPLTRVLSLNKLFTGLLLVILVVYSGLTIARNQDWKDNLTLYSTDVNRSPHSARAQYNYGSELMTRFGDSEDQQLKNEKLAEAAIHLKKAVEIFPFYLDAFNNLGNVYSKLEKRDSAAWFYAKTIGLDSNYLKGYYNLGINYYAMGRYPEAIPLLEKYAAFRPESPKLFYYLGNSYGSMGKFDEAIMCLEKELQFRGDETETCLLLGKAYGFKGNLLKSLEIFNRALVLDPKNAELLFNIGLTHAYLGSTAESAMFYERALVENPDMIPALIELAKAYERLGKPADASLVRNRVNKLNPQK